MVAIMHDARGVGLAAPQIGRLSRLVVIRPVEDEPQPVTLCNPRVVWRSEEEETDFEGCLSIGEISVEVPRAVAVRVTAQDIERRTVRAGARGLRGPGRSSTRSTTSTGS